MGRLLLDARSLRMEIDPALGGSVTGLWLGGPGGAMQPLLRPTPEGLAGPGAFLQTSCYLMAPWVNRVAGAAFGFAGHERRLRVNWGDGTAIHGEVKDRPLTVLDRSPVSARLLYESRHCSGEANWPWPFLCEARYELGPGRVEFELGLTNTGDEPFPAGLGWHPFFARRLWDAADDVRVRLHAGGRYPLRACLPTGAPEARLVPAELRDGAALGGLELDDLFSLASPGGEAAWIEWPASGVRARFLCSEEITHAVVFSPAASGGGPEPWFCLEPCTMATDAFNLAARGVGGSGLRVLQPGGRLEARWTLEIES